MCPRPYRSDRRKAATEETRRRIVGAAVDLHAENGVLATTYAMIAKRADVVVPTVYNHFPTRRDLLGACTGDVAAGAPPLDARIYDGAADAEARLLALVRAQFAYYHYYAPWMGWGLNEARFLPEIEAWITSLATTRRELIALALAPAFADTPPPALVTLCEILLDFPAWQHLTDKQDTAAAEAGLSDALAGLMLLHLDTPRPGKPRAKRTTK